MKRFNINIRTRLLAYFLFATLLPLLVLAILSSASVQFADSNITSLIFKIALVTSLGSIALSFIFSTLTTKPIFEIVDMAKSIEEGDFSRRMEVKGDNEIAFLAKSFNRMSAALEKRQEAEMAREILVATLAHDLKVPLVAGLRTLEYMQDGSYGELNEKQKYITEQMAKSQQDLLVMVASILDSYKYDAGKYELEKQNTDINLLIEESICDLTPIAKGKEIELVFNANTDIDRLNIDRQEIKRVLQNLISNAITHTSKNGEVVLNIKQYSNKVIVTVSDNGVGISDEYLGKIFDRYSTSQGGLKKVGTGLGLYLSRQIIEAHGGQISVESAVDKGSTFKFFIPVGGIDE